MQFKRPPRPSTWKTVTQIPHKWNEASFLQQQHNYVLNRVTSIGQKLIFIDESGFNSQTHPSHGYLLIGIGHDLLRATERRWEKNCKQHLQLPPPPLRPLPPWIDHHHGQHTNPCQQKNSKPHSYQSTPFLNPIKLAFNILKTHVKHTKICSQLDLAQAI
ncbi:hypothetical protein VP01_266g4 [Puccinia sorghi]|uniref:Uncharacterized protein n=1 Tax=Puccinia sorghi TaxID=27349 RepID=A0A0L6V414_9BASI|nr:hypothetical protein VP01_266g4 [Puccinia sorghi]